jgi:hypothetical protein
VFRQLAATRDALDQLQGQLHLSTLRNDALMKRISHLETAVRDGVATELALRGELARVVALRQHESIDATKQRMALEERIARLLTVLRSIDASFRGD